MNVTSSSPIFFSSSVLLSEAKDLNASRIGLYPVQRHRFPPIESSISSIVILGLASSMLKLQSKKGKLSLHIWVYLAYWISIQERDREAQVSHLRLFTISVHIKIQTFVISGKWWHVSTVQLDHHLFPALYRRVIRVIYLLEFKYIHLSSFVYCS